MFVLVWLTHHIREFQRPHTPEPGGRTRLLPSVSQTYRWPSRPAVQEAVWRKQEKYQILLYNKNKSRIVSHIERPHLSCGYNLSCFQTWIPENVHTTGSRLSPEFAFHTWTMQQEFLGSEISGAFSWGVVQHVEAGHNALIPQQILPVFTYSTLTLASGDSSYHSRHLWFLLHVWHHFFILRYLLSRVRKVINTPPCFRRREKLRRKSAGSHSDICILTCSPCRGCQEIIQTSVHV